MITSSISLEEREDDQWVVSLRTGKRTFCRMSKLELGMSDKRFRTYGLLTLVRCRVKLRVANKIGIKVRSKLYQRVHR